MKCNINGASKGNPGPSSAEICIRDYNGNLVAAKGFKIQDTTNIVAEARAIRESIS
uniref:RNase H family protein n=1 Tax=Solanum tuberosum TaxID=4113 RepID=M1AUB4_SOLTU